MSINDAVNESVATVDQESRKPNPILCPTATRKSSTVRTTIKPKLPSDRIGSLVRVHEDRARAPRFGQRPRPLNTTRPTRAFGRIFGRTPRSRPARPTERQGTLFYTRCCGHPPMARNRDREESAPENEEFPSDSNSNSCWKSAGLGIESYITIPESCFELTD